MMSIILALSDTHLTGPLADGNYYPLQLRNLVKKANLVLHAGDFGCQEAYDDLVRLCNASKCELWAIQGNQNTIIYRDGVLLPLQKAEDWFGIKIGLIHYEDASHDLSCVLPKTAKEAQEIIMENTGDVGADVLVFGHIHEPIIKWYKDENGKEQLLVCPGPGSNGAIDLTHKCPPYPTVALLEWRKGNITSAEIITIVWQEMNQKSL
jgi:putative phosphoesterase